MIRWICAVDPLRCLSEIVYPYDSSWMLSKIPISSSTFKRAMSSMRPCQWLLKCSWTVVPRGLTNWQRIRPRQNFCSIAMYKSTKSWWKSEWTWWFRFLGSAFLQVLWRDFFSAGGAHHGSGPKRHTTLWTRRTGKACTILAGILLDVCDVFRMATKNVRMNSIELTLCSNCTMNFSVDTSRAYEQPWQVILTLNSIGWQHYLTRSFLWWRILSLMFNNFSFCLLDFSVLLCPYMRLSISESDTQSCENDFW